MVDRNPISVPQLISFIGVAALSVLLLNITILAMAGFVVSSIYQPKPPHASRPDATPLPQITSGYAEAASEFEAEFLGPYVHKGTQLNPLDANHFNYQRVLVVGPGVQLSSQQEAAAKTIYIDISVSDNGSVSLPQRNSGGRASPDELTSSSFAYSWRFDRGGKLGTWTVKRVPVRVLHLEGGVSGVVDIPSGANCDKPKIRQSYDRYSWNSLTGHHETEVAADGDIKFSGSGGTLFLDGHASVPPEVVRRSFTRVLSSDLLRASASIGAWRATDSGHGGSFAFYCGKRTLLSVMADDSDDKAPFDINAEIESLAGIKRWTVGNDGTPGILERNSWQFHNLQVLRGVAQNGSAKGILALAAHGMPMTEEEQRAKSITERVNVLEIMAQRGDIGSLRTLLASPIRWSKSQLADALVIVAGTQSDIATVDSLIKAGADPRTSYSTSGRTVLMAAAANGHSNIVARILQFDRNPNRADKDGNRAIHHLVGGFPGLQPRVWASPEERLKALDLLLTAGANVNAVNSRGETAAMLSSRQPGLLDLLLKHGANPNARDLLGRTPLMRSSTLDAVKILLEHGADARAKGKHGETVLNSVGLPDAVPLLIAAGADVTLADEDGRTPLMMMAQSAPATRLLIAKGANVNARDRFDQTVLMKCPSATVAQILLESGADPTLRDKWGKTASDRATELYSLPHCKEAGEVILNWMKSH